jgi:2-amino-4-hydroxy-6-hydroxymethyldihydropteridine diphosphokinase
VLKNAFVLWPLALLAPEVKHPGVQISFARLWADAQIEQKLWPVPFQWRGVGLTPAALIEAHPAA